MHVIDATGKERRCRLDRVFTGYAHGYFSQTAAVLADIRELPVAGRGGDEKTPHERSKDRFESVPYRHAAGRSYWKLKERASFRP